MDTQNEDILDTLVGIPKATIDKMLEVEHPAETIALYVFYYYTAKWQRTNMPKCTTSYSGKGLNWGRDKVIKHKKTLEEIGLIEDYKRKDTKGKIVGWYIKVKYILKKETISTPLKSPLVVESDTNALSTNRLNALNTNNTIPPNIDDVKAYIKEKSFTVNADIWYDFYESKGWNRNSNPSNPPSSAAPPSSLSPAEQSVLKATRGY
jgi:hypothetical protein